MPSRSDLLRLTDELGLSSLLPQLGELVRSSIRLRTVDSTTTKPILGASRIGGIPDLPDCYTWPDWNGEPLAFLAQVDLSRVTDLDVDHLLPASGILYFFWDAYQRADGMDPALHDAWRVLFFDDARSKLRRCTVPSNLSVGARYPGYALETVGEVTIPPVGSVEFEKLELSDKERGSYIELCQALRRDPGKRVPIHRMLGHPDAVQTNDMRLDSELFSRGQICEDLGIRTKQQANRIRKQLGDPASQWELLFQLDSDDHDLPWDIPRMEWGDAGRLFFWIRRNKLIRREFDEVWFQFQSS